MRTLLADLFQIDACLNTLEQLDYTGAVAGSSEHAGTPFERVRQ
jgi:hypothetical protein